MVVEILAGIALAKSAVSGIKSAIDAAKDVNDIAHHIDDLFRGQDQIRKKVAKDKKSKPLAFMPGVHRPLTPEEEEDLRRGQKLWTPIPEEKKPEHTGTPIPEQKKEEPPVSPPIEVKQLPGFPIP